MPAVPEAGVGPEPCAYPGKRLLDMALAAVLLALTSPVLAALAAIIKVDSPGPALFRGERVGLGMRPFLLLKFRTMVSEASPPGADRIAASNQQRVTRVGRWLRRTKLDELPQLANVLRGEMSLVGPRPEGYRYVVHYSEEQLGVFRARPGMTGLAQLLLEDEAEILAGRPDPEAAYVSEVVPRKLSLDLRYLESCSLALDLQVLFCTAFRVLLGTRWVPRAFRSLAAVAREVGFASGGTSSNASPLLRSC